MTKTSVTGELQQLRHNQKVENKINTICQHKQCGVDRQETENVLYCKNYHCISFHSLSVINRHDFMTSHVQLMMHMATDSSSIFSCRMWLARPGLCSVTGTRRNSGPY